MPAPEIERLIQLLAKLPGLGPRSARRVALYLVRHKADALDPLAEAMSRAAAAIRACSVCGNLDAADPCAICTDPKRDRSFVCVVETVADLWALERAGACKGRYHVLGGALSALDGIGPEELRIGQLVDRARAGEIKEVVLATNATVSGQTTAHYIAERLHGAGVSVTGLAHGVPLGGELDYMDDGTLVAALKARHRI
jgi:recombination protein RecR